MTNIYECSVCKGHNHVSRLHCQYCGAVPNSYYIPTQLMTVAAKGADRQEMHHAQRVNLRTVPAGYYATE